MGRSLPNSHFGARVGSAGPSVVKSWQTRQLDQSMSVQADSSARRRPLSFVTVLPTINYYTDSDHGDTDRNRLHARLHRGC